MLVCHTKSSCPISLVEAKVAHTMAEMVTRQWLTFLPGEVDSVSPLLKRESQEKKSPTKRVVMRKEAE